MASLLRLPRHVLEAAPCKVRLEAVAGLWRTRLVGGSIAAGAARLPAQIAPPRGPDGRRAARARPRSPDPRGAAGLGPRAAVQLCRHTAQSWAAQDWPDTAFARLGARTKTREGESFGAEDAEALRAFLRAAHTVVLAETEDAAAPFAARLLVQGRPLADVVTWVRAGTSTAAAGGGPRPASLGVLLGETLGGAFAVRGHVFDACPASVLTALGRGEPRALELWLASNPALRWAHAPAALTRRTGPVAGWSPVEPRPGGGSGRLRLAPGQGRPARAPAPRPRPRGG